MKPDGTLEPGDPGYQAPGTGLINVSPAGTTVAPSPQVTGYTPSQATAEKPVAVGYEAQPFTVATESTVAGQLEKITAKDSPLLQQARVRAAQGMNERGLLNSSIALGAGEQAVISQALPIAQQDAGSQFTAMVNTINAKNAAAYAKAAAENTASLQGAELGTRTNLANTEALNRQRAEAAQAANQLRQQEFDRTIRVELMTLENNYRQLLQTNQNLANLYQQVSTNIGNIAANAEMTPEAKEAATATQMNLLREALAATQAVAKTGGVEVKQLNLKQFFQPATPAAPPAVSPTPPAPGFRPAPSVPPLPPGSSSFYSFHTPQGWVTITTNGQVYDHTMQKFRAPISRREVEQISRAQAGGRYGERR